MDRSYFNRNPYDDETTRYQFHPDDQAYLADSAMMTDKDWYPLDRENSTYHEEEQILNAIREYIHFLRTNYMTKSEVWENDFKQLSAKILKFRCYNEGNPFNNLCSDLNELYALFSYHNPGVKIRQSLLNEWFTSKGTNSSTRYFYEIYVTRMHNRHIKNINRLIGQSNNGTKCSLTYLDVIGQPIENYEDSFF